MDVIVYLLWLVFVTALPLAALGVGMAVVSIVKSIWKRQLRRDRVTPLTRKLRRLPGESLRDELAELDLDFGATLAGLIFTPVCVLAFHLCQSYFARAPESPMRTAGMVLGTVVVFVLGGRQIYSILKRRRDCTVGLQGELATADWLDELRGHDCHVMHDVPFDYGNIDHVIVGPAGIFTVETKTWGKPPVEADGDRSTAHVDRSEGRIRLPDRILRIPEDQARGQAKWLGEHLTRTVGVPMSVEPTVALPGWKIKRTGSGSVLVFSPRNPEGLFTRDSGNRLDGNLVERAAAQVKILCENVEPAFKAERQRTVS